MKQRLTSHCRGRAPRAAEFISRYPARTCTQVEIGVRGAWDGKCWAPCEMRRRPG